MPLCAKQSLMRFLVLISFCLTSLNLCTGSWDEWWTYDGISGVDFWGLLNRDWRLCKEGKRQSPVDIVPANLVFDPLLRPLLIDKSTRVRGTLENNGHGLVFQMTQRVEASASSTLDKFLTSSPTPSDHQSAVTSSQGQKVLDSNLISSMQSKASSHQHQHQHPHQSSSSHHHPHLSSSSTSSSSSSSSTVNHGHHSSHISSVNVTGGPLSYTYALDSIHLHFGTTDAKGSEHTIEGIAFPGELQILGYNSDLYRNFSDASKRPHGLVTIAALIQIGDWTSEELKVLTANANKIRFKGQIVSIDSLSIHSLLPNLDRFMTYDGSMTSPGCFETVTWIILNKPLNISRQDIYSLRKIMQGDSETPKAPLGNNFRPIQPLNQRYIRTNIDFTRKQGNQCPSMATKQRQYQVNSKHLNPNSLT